MADPVAASRSIRSRGLLLEPIEETHAELLFSYLQSTQLYTFIPHDPPKSVDALIIRYRRWSARTSADGSEIWLNFVVREGDQKVPVGTVQATCLNDASAMIAYDVFDGRRRQGIGRRACSILISELFDVHDVQMIFALVDTRNMASWMLLEALGFRRVETIENADHFKGSRSDEFRYELAKFDWLVPEPGLR